MALSKSSLSAKIKAAIEAEFDINAEFGDDILQKFSDAVADAVVDEITSNAVVTSTGATGTGPFGGPLPIASLPGTVS